MLNKIPNSNVFGYGIEKIIICETSKFDKDG